MTDLLFFCSVGKEPAYIISCDSCGRRSVVSSDHKRYCPVCGPDAVTPISVTRYEEPPARQPIIVPSKRLAFLTDELEGAMVRAARCFGEGITMRTVDETVLDALYLESDYRSRFEALISDFLRDAVGIEYESDGSDF